MGWIGAVRTFAVGCVFVLLQASCGNAPDQPSPPQGGNRDADTDQSDGSASVPREAGVEGGGTDGGVDAPTCPPGLLSCDGTCIDPDFDPAHCGTCGKSCGAGLFCLRGTCSLSCSGGTIQCGTRCVDPQVDRGNCGGCGASDPKRICKDGEICSAGTCGVSCRADLVECEGRCLDPLFDPQHCGATPGCGVSAGRAGTACGKGMVCSGGTCQSTCAVGLVKCGGRCIDLQNSRDFCGATAGCGLSGTGSAGTSCGAGQVCSGGSCQVSCQTGLVNCDATCVDPSSSRQHCGASGACGVGGRGSAGSACPAGQVCSAGTCQVSCQAGLVECGGTCVDPGGSRQHWRGDRWLRRGWEGELRGDLRRGDGL